MDHSYEEIRAAALDVLAGREPPGPYGIDQFSHLRMSIAGLFRRRESRPDDAYSRHDIPDLSPADADLSLEVFWDLFREGIITLGASRGDPQFPFFRVSQFGRRIIDNQKTYFLHDVSTYTELIQKEVPDIDPVTLLYLQEAMQAFRAGCLLSATVLLGVATEHTFLLLLETIENSHTHKSAFAAVAKERFILPKFNKFREILTQDYVKVKGSLPKEVKEDIDTHFAGTLAIIRLFRNESGHPSGEIVGREQVYVLLNLFPTYCKKVYQLKKFFAGAT